VKITGTLAKIGRNTAFDLLAVHKMTLVVNIQYDPNMSGYGQLFAHRRWKAYGAQFLGFAADGVFLTFHKDTIELEGVDHTLTGKPNDQTALLCLMDVGGLNQMLKKHFVVILGNPMEVVEP